MKETMNVLKYFYNNEFEVKVDGDANDIHEDLNILIE